MTTRQCCTLPIQQKPHPPRLTTYRSYSCEEVKPAGAEAGGEGAGGQVAVGAKLPREPSDSELSKCSSIERGIHSTSRQVSCCCC